MKKIAKMQNLSQNELNQIEERVINHEMNLSKSQK